jgi:hypothetical protein
MSSKRVLEVDDQVHVGGRLELRPGPCSASSVPVDYGLDVRAEAFGDQVFLDTRMHSDGTLEAVCPLSGEWTGFGFLVAGFLLKSDRPNAHRSWLPCTPFLNDKVPRWTSMPVKDILAKQRERYHLPRGWNPNADGWIGHQQLTELYESYLKEKSDADGTETTRRDDPPGAASEP